MIKLKYLIFADLALAGIFSLSAIGCAPSQSQIEQHRTQCINPVQQEDYHQAVADCTETIYWDDEVYVLDGYYNRGKAYYNLGEYEKAIADFTQAINMNPDFAEAYQSRGIAYQASGDYQKADRDFNQAKEIQLNLGQ